MWTKSLTVRSKKQVEKKVEKCWPEVDKSRPNIWPKSLKMLAKAMAKAMAMAMAKAMAMALAWALAWALALAFQLFGQILGRLLSTSGRHFRLFFNFFFDLTVKDLVHIGYGKGEKNWFRTILRSILTTFFRGSGNGPKWSGMAIRGAGAGKNGRGSGERSD